MKHHGSASGDWHGARLAGIALVLMLTTGLTPTVLAAPGGEPGKPESMPNGGPGPAGNPGSQRAQEQRTKESPAVRTRAHGAPGASKGRKTGASKGKKVRRRGPGTQTTARSNPTPPPQAKAGKTTICHSTGSDTNPYVEITVSNNALPAHGRHHDGRDIIPAPEGGCETTVAASENRVAASGVRGARRSEEAERSAGVNRRRTDERVAAQVLGAQASSPEADDAAGTIAEEDEDGGSLPFTGLALAGILGTALLALVGGVAARRSAS